MKKSDTFNEKGELVKRTLTDEDQSSIKITINAKGFPTAEIKVYKDDAEEMDTKLEKYLEIAKAHMEVIRGAIE